MTNRYNNHKTSKTGFKTSSRETYCSPSLSHCTRILRYSWHLCFAHILHRAHQLDARSIPQFQKSHKPKYYSHTRMLKTYLVHTKLHSGDFFIFSFTFSIFSLITTCNFYYLKIILFYISAFIRNITFYIQIKESISWYSFAFFNHLIWYTYPVSNFRGFILFWLFLLPVR